MELYKGLPLRNIEVTTKFGQDQMLSVSTELVNDLINIVLNDVENNKDIIAEIEEFDETISYFVSSSVFEGTDEELKNYINKEFFQEEYYK